MISAVFVVVGISIMVLSLCDFTFFAKIVKINISIFTTVLMPLVLTIN